MPFFAILICLFCLASGSNAKANGDEFKSHIEDSSASVDDINGAAEYPVFDEHYLIHEGALVKDPTINPLAMMGVAIQDVAEWSLMKMDLVREKIGEVKERYQRKKHFGGWIRDPREQDCLNTRGKVLVRDSREPVQRSANHCLVESGLWDDPYSGEEVKQAQELQIDHMVPLKHAYMTGADQWNYRKRCLYGNFLGNPAHLIPVLGRENQAKGDESFVRYLPPRTPYRCEYIRNWMMIKLVWQLGITPPEKDAFLDLIEKENCDPKLFEITVSFLRQQRKFIEDNMSLCAQGSSFR
jgi:hypothetical protein